jgi:type IV secretory pathway VirB10-like protein
MKVLTHRPRYIEPVVVPEFGEGTSTTTKAKQAAPTM